MSLWFNSSELAATEVGCPFTSSPTTRTSRVDDPSATLMTLTPAPLAERPAARAALKVASPQTVGGYVPSTASVGGFEMICRTAGIDTVKGAVKGDPVYRSSPARLA